MLASTIKQLAAQYKGDTIDIRRHIHKNPELSFEEHNTAAYVCGVLDSYGIFYKKGVAGTGIVALIKGQNPDSKSIALRGDMDALPIKELSDITYKSVNEGVMHACGHDVHTACLLGAARILHETRSQWNGTIKLIFQPGEEKLPGGASLMIKEGVLQNPTPSAIIGQHVMPFIDTGKVGFRKGMYMASTDEIYVVVKGKGGHGAFPHQSIDSVLIASHIVVALQQIVSRNTKPGLPTVLSFGKVEAKGATNVIPAEVRMEGTFRTFNEEWRVEAHERMTKMAVGIAESMGASCDFIVAKGYPMLYNNEETTERAINAAKEYLGEANVEELEIWPAGEDFAFYSHHVPACFYRLGTRNEAKGTVHPVHTPYFDIDEDAIETGIGLMAWLAVKELEN